MKDKEKETRRLPVALTDAEVLERAHALIEADEELDAIEKDKKDELERLKELKDDAIDRKRTARDAVKNKAEDRDVECEWEADWSAKEWRLKRKDTGEVVEAQTMSKEDLKLKLDFDDKGGNGKKSPRKGGK